MFRKEIRWIRMSFPASQLEEKIPEVKFVAGRKMAFVRTPEGIFAIEDRCPHNGFSLSQGTTTEDGLSIVCPLHRYQYNMKTGRCSHGSGGAARVFPVEEREDGLYIGIEETRWGW
jgi:3-phenylpropionate/trans-cinnamate dioxygenase ferredoxin subunit